MAAILYFSSKFFQVQVATTFNGVSYVPFPPEMPIANYQNIS